MPRLLAALVMIILLIGYYIFKTQIQEEKKVDAPTQKTEPIKPVQKKDKPISVSQKKKNFYKIMVKPLNEVYAQLMDQYTDVKGLIKVNPQSQTLLNLQKKYKVNNNEELLVALKPHPKSIAIAQGAMESAWGTSRFFNKAYNIFGVWSFNPKDKRIAAGEQRGSQTIWLRKYDSVKESIEDYYLTMSRSKAFKAFKALNAQTRHPNPYLLVKKLDKYSEKGALYGEELAAMISYNNFTQYDAVHYAKPAEPKKIEKQAEKKLEEKKVEQKEQKKEPALIEVVDTIQDNESSFSDILKDIQPKQ